MQEDLVMSKLEDKFDALDGLELDSSRPDQERARLYMNRMFHEVGADGGCSLYPGTYDQQSVVFVRFFGGRQMPGEELAWVSCDRESMLQAVTRIVLVRDGSDGKWRNISVGRHCAENMAKKVKLTHLGREVSKLVQSAK